MRVVQSTYFPKRVGPIEVLIAIVCAVSLADFAYRWSRILGFFWDISVYQRAIADYGSGVDPYRTDVLFPFVYHPLVLRLLTALGFVVPLKVVLPVLTVAAIVWLARELREPAAMLVGRRPTAEVTGGQSAGAAPSGVVSPARFLAAFVMAAAFGGVGTAACMSGNLAVLMHFALMAALLRGSRASGLFFRLLPYGLIVLFALVKPYFLLYLAIPVVLYERRMIALASSMVVVLLFGATWLSFQVYWPQEYAQFLANLRWHILGRGDMGYSFFFVFGALTHKVPLALALHVLICVVLVVIVPQLFKQRYGRDVPFVPQLLVLYLVLTLANPRMKDYDLFPALVGFFAVFGLLFRPGLAIILGARLMTLLGAAAVVHWCLSSPQRTRCCWIRSGPGRLSDLRSWACRSWCSCRSRSRNLSLSPAAEARGTYVPALRPLLLMPIPSRRAEGPMMRRPRE